MGKFDGILICTDLDGTLYRNDKTISRENKEAIAYFKGEGGLLTFITGRMPYSACDAYRMVQPNAPYGCVNGGGLYDGAADQYIWTCALSDEFVTLVEQIDKEYPQVGIQICTFERTYFAKDNQAMVEFRRVTGLPHYICDYHTVQETIAKVIFGTECEEELLNVERTLRTHPLAEQFDFVRSERTLFEILPKGVHKGLVMEKLVNHLNIDPEKTIAIGDYDNDVGMLRVAKYGVAVANACKAALEAADIITVSNEEHAIAKLVQDLESGGLCDLNIEG